MEDLCFLVWNLLQWNKQVDWLNSTMGMKTNWLKTMNGNNCWDAFQRLRAINWQKGIAGVYFCIPQHFRGFLLIFSDPLISFSSSHYKISSLKNACDRFKSSTLFIFFVVALIFCNSFWRLRGHFGEIALHPSGSFTVKTCFTASNLSLREAILSELLSVRSELSKTKQGSYILRELDVDRQVVRYMLFCTV